VEVVGVVEVTSPVLVELVALLELDVPTSDDAVADPALLPALLPMLLPALLLVLLPALLLVPTLDEVEPAFVELLPVVELPVVPFAP
jgi:hypothetical protein